MNFYRLKKSFGNASKGVIYVYKNEQNFRLQIYIAIIVLIATWLFGLRNSEIIVIFLLITIVLILELFNSAVERFADVLKPRLFEQIGIVKDIMSAAVFIASLSSLIIAIIIFYPYFLELIQR